MPKHLVGVVVAMIGLAAWCAASAQPHSESGLGEKTTPTYQESGEPEGHPFHFPALAVDPGVRNLGDPELQRLADRIETGEATLIERRAWDRLLPRLFPFDSMVPGEWRLGVQRRIKQMEEVRAESARASGSPLSFTTHTWQPLGPQAYTLGSDGISGRATAVWVDPSDRNRILLGTADGGVWKSTDQGLSWVPIFDSAASPSIGSIAVDPDNSNVIYVGTGEGNSNSDMINGVGMYKSTDGGATWTLLSLPAWTYNTFWHSIRRIAVDPLDSNKVYAAVDGGLLYSSDAGASWTKTTCGASTGPYIGSDLFLDSVNGSGGQSILYVAFGYPNAVTDNGIYRSTAGGAGPWTKISTGTGFPTSNVGRITLVGSPSDPTKLYALVHSTATQGSLGIFYTAAANASPVAWTAKSTTNYCAAQCWYDMVGVVHPTNPAYLIVGGLDNYLSTDSGGSLTRVSLWTGTGTSFSHADHHHLVMADGTTLYNANDGGFFIGTVDWSAKTVSWVNRNNGLGTLQFYGFAQHPTDPDLVMGGLQDNGQAYFDGSQWVQVEGGDGGESAWDPVNPSYGYEEYVYAIISRNSTLTSNPYNWSTCIRNFGGCTTFTTRCSGSCVPDGATAFIAPFTLDANNPNTMYTGSKYPYANTSVRTGNTWTQLSATDFTVGGTGHYILAIHSARNNGTSGTIYMGTSNGKAWRTTNGGSNWTEVTSGLAVAAITSFTTDPADGQKVLVTLSGFGTSHVYRSTDGGTSWTDISGALPADPFNCIALDPADANHAYAGSDFGIFENTSVWTSNTWTSVMGNLPPVSVEEIGFNVSNGKLRVATHGRGVWERTSVITASYPQETSGSGDMTAAKGAGSTVQVTYTNACGATDNTVYFGDLDSLAASGPNWTGRACSVGTSGTASFDPGTGNTYFVIVGNNAVGMEGSYGTDSSGGQRPAAGAGSPCSYTQVLNATCP